MTKLVAISIPGGPEFVQAVERVWADGNAFTPLDPRLPLSEAQKVLDVLRPEAIIEQGGQQQALPTFSVKEVEPHNHVQDGDAVVLTTSGTSGQPKGVIHTHRSVEASALATSKALGVNPEKDRWLACLPLSHIGGLSVVLRSLITGTPVEVHPRFDPEAVMSSVARGVTLTSLVTRALHQVDPSAFRTILVGGAAPPENCPPNVLPTYGMTETGSGVVYGHSILEGVELALLDVEGQPTLPQNTGSSSTEAEIAVRGPMLFRRYTIGADPFLPDGWFPTGDQGRWGANGELQVVGRIGESIVSGGEKVWPSRSEATIRLLPGVADVVVVGRPDPEWGHIVVAIIVPSTSETLPSLTEVRRHVKKSLPSWYAPQELKLITAFPKTQSGKIQRHLL